MVVLKVEYWDELMDDGKVVQMVDYLVASMACKKVAQLVELKDLKSVEKMDEAKADGMVVHQVQ